MYALCKINLAIVLYVSVHPHRILSFIFGMKIQGFPCKKITGLSIVAVKILRLAANVDILIISGTQNHLQATVGH